MTRTEAERQFYLGVTGVRLWYAREPLPGAAPSPDFDFGDTAPAPQPARELELKEPVQPEKPESSPARTVNLRALMDGVSQEASEVGGGDASPLPVNRALAETAVSASPAEASDDEGVEASEDRLLIRLELQVWLGRQFALISDLSSDASLRLQDTLARNILKSVGDEVVQVLGPLHWPVFNNPVVPGSRMEELIDVARAMLAPCVDQRSLLLGVPGTNEEEGGVHWLSSATRQAPMLEFSHSLAQIAGDPALKRELWSCLKPLVRS
ncbi:2-isopropylmalate synthase [Marinobacter santoriniensis NKSG1]|uniref:2-isopropylmalate synthase n=1 Tax=Marinobacter santoriniensis NKSG1 TaxID=1288826 RepID=M7CVA4_9GAMM|nr:hypothetical protein [Marinobacter santoriniensis]EMP57486.1 2-isopropylmalate synthase [Marinobacter santoriniensis NKSG1]